MARLSPLALISSILVLGTSLVSAHFTLDFPQTRGFDENTEPQFCGGFPTVANSSRALFPLGNAPIVIDSHHPTAQVAILISLNPNPTSFADFNSTTSGTPLPLLKQFGTINGQGIFCFNVDVQSTLTAAGVGSGAIANGSLATIQVEFNGGDGVLFQCSDVILSSTYTASNVTCSNATASASASGSGSASASAGSPSPTKSAAVLDSQVSLFGMAAALLMVVGSGVLVFA